MHLCRVEVHRNRCVMDMFTLFNDWCTSVILTHRPEAPVHSSLCMCLCAFCMYIPNAVITNCFRLSVTTSFTFALAWTSLSIPISRFYRDAWLMCCEDYFDVYPIPVSSSSNGPGELTPPKNLLTFFPIVMQASSFSSAAAWVAGLRNDNNYSEMSCITQIHSYKNSRLDL